MFLSDNSIFEQKQTLSVEVLPESGLRDMLSNTWGGLQTAANWAMTPYRVTRDAISGIRNLQQSMQQLPQTENIQSLVENLQTMSNNMPNEEALQDFGQLTDEIQKVKDVINDIDVDGVKQTIEKFQEAIQYGQDKVTQFRDYEAHIKDKISQLRDLSNMTISVFDALGWIMNSYTVSSAIFKFAQFVNKNNPREKANNCINGTMLLFRKGLFLETDKFEYLN